MDAIRSSPANSTVDEPAEGPYENYVLRLVPHWPHLRIVADFMSSDLEDTPTPFTKITFNTDVRVIDIVRSEIQFSYTYTTENSEFHSIDQLRQFINTPRTGIYRRFVMVEDLSPEVIEFLGSTFNLDPEFFAQHLSDWWTNHKGFSSSENTLHQLGSSARKLGFQHFEFQRAYDWEETGWVENASNLWQPYISQGIKPEVFVNEGFSAYSHCYHFDSRWTGIYLFDRPLYLRAPQLYAGIRNFRRRPAFDVTQTQLSGSAHQLVEQGRLEWHHKSLRDETAQGILNMSVNDIAELPAPSYNILELDLPLRVLLSSWVLVANILNRKMCGLEDQIASNIWGSALSNAEVLIQLVKLRKHALEFSSSLERTLFTLQTNLSKIRNSLELQEDAKQLIAEFTKIAARGDTNSPAFLAKSAVEEAQKTCAQVEMMKQLTMLAFVFVPITSFATVLSIQDSPPWRKYSILAGLSIPVLVLALVLSGGSRPYHRPEKKPAALPVKPSYKPRGAGSYKMPGGFL